MVENEEQTTKANWNQSQRRQMVFYLTNRNRNIIFPSTSLDFPSGCYPFAEEENY